MTMTVNNTTEWWYPASRFTAAHTMSSAEEILYVCSGARNSGFQHKVGIYIFRTAERLSPFSSPGFHFNGIPLTLSQWTDAERAMFPFSAEPLWAERWCLVW